MLEKTIVMAVCNGCLFPVAIVVNLETQKHTSLGRSHWPLKGQIKVK